jgi:hypothetical protein
VLRLLGNQRHFAGKGIEVIKRKVISLQIPLAINKHFPEHFYMQSTAGDSVSVGLQPWFPPSYNQDACGSGMQSQH